MNFRRLDKYRSLGIEFPSAPVNNALWGVWSFIFAGIILYLSKKMGWLEVTAILWICGFPLMWIVIGNLNVLPLPILWYAVPLSIVEVGVAGFICSRIGKQ